MAIDFPSLVYSPGYDIFARPATYTPKVGLPFGGRGIFNTVALDVMAEDGTILSDQKTIFDILETEYPVMPVQNDQVYIPASDGMPELGNYEIIDASTNGGGETTLTLRKVLPKKP